MSETTSSMQALVTSFERGEIGKTEYFKRRGQIIERSGKAYEKKHEQELGQQQKRKKYLHHGLILGGFILGALVIWFGISIIVQP